MPKRSQKNLSVSGEEVTHRKASTGTIKSDSGIRQIPDSEPYHQSVSITKMRNISAPSQAFGLASSAQVKMEQTRFPKLEEYAHFHYDIMEIPTLKLSICADDASGYKHNIELSEDSGMFLVTVTGSAPKSWLIKRSLENFATLDIQLHRCIFDRRFSHLDDLNTAHMEIKSRQELQTILQNYLSHLSELAGGMINCGSVLSWMEMDNRGHRLVATDDSGINTPAIAAAHVVKRYNAQATDEISLQVGDMISVIDMPSMEDTIWWRGKRGFEVGFFPGECVEIIGDKVPTSMASRVPEPLATAAASRRPCEEPSTTTIAASSSSSSVPSPSPSRYLTSRTSSLVGHLSLSSSSAESSPAMMKKHGKLLSFLRTFFSHRPPRNQLKQSGIVKERVFGCDLGEHLLNSGHDVPLLLKSCTDIIEEHGIVHGIYRLSGITSNIQKLRLAFDEDRVPDLTDDCYLQDIHSISSLLKMYFRELPNPLLTYQLYDKFADAVRDEDNKLLKIHDVVQQLPPPHYRTTEYLMRHLARVAAFGHETEMHSKNLAIVWAPNLLRSKELEAGGGAAALQGVGIQAVVTECLICYCDIIFSDKMPSYSSQDSLKGHRKVRPKSLAISTPTRLLSLEEARERAFTGHLAPKKFIDVGGGPRNLPSKYHTVIDLPGYRKRAPSSAKENKPVSGNKKMSTTCAGGGSGGWKSIFTKPRSGSIKKSRKLDLQDSVTLGTAQAKALTEEDVHNWKRHLRSAKSAESLFSLIHTPSSHGSSLNSTASFSNIDTTTNHMQENFCIHSQDKSSRYQLSHKRSLSSDASTVLHHSSLSKEGPPLVQAVVHDAEKNTQSFIRGDSTRKALHRRLPSAPGTPQQDRREPGTPQQDRRETLSPDESMAEFLYTQFEHGRDVNIDEQINSRLLQVAEKTRSAKSNEELTSNKRLATSPSKSRKKAKGASDFHMDANDELSTSIECHTDRKIISSSDNTTDISPYDNSSHLRMVYSRFHDYAEIVSDDEVGVVYTPDSQATMSVSSSGCNMQDLLDQMDTRLALNAQLFPRQGIGDTTSYRVGDPLFCVDTSDPPRNNGRDVTRSQSTPDREMELCASARNSTFGKAAAGSQQTVDFSLSANQFCNQTSAEQQVEESFQNSHSSENHDNQTNSLGCQATVDADVASKKLECGIFRQTVLHKAVDKTNNGAHNSTLVGRRHAEFIPSMSATAHDLRNLNELLNSLEEDNLPLNIHSKTKVLAKTQKTSHICPDHHDSGKVVRQEDPTSDSFESKIFALDKKGDGRLATMSSSGGGMSKCLSVPSDIAKSLENVTESQSDMLSSVTISELSVSINSFSNSLVQDGAIHTDEITDPGHRRSTSLDSLTESDHLMTRTLHEINRQMEAAFKHNHMNSSGCSLDTFSHDQRLIASDLNLSSSSVCEQRTSVVDETPEQFDVKASSVNITEDNTNTESSSQFVTGIVRQHQSDTALPLLGQADFSLTSPLSKMMSATVLSNSGSDSHLELMSGTVLSNSGSDSHLELMSGTVCQIGGVSPTRENLIFFSESNQRHHDALSCSSGAVIDRLVNVENVFSRQTEKQTHRQNDEHIVIETKHVVKFKSADVDRIESVAASKSANMDRLQSVAASHQQKFKSADVKRLHSVAASQQKMQTQSDIANVCKNRSSSSSSSDTSSEELDKMAELSKGERCQCNFTLPLSDGRGCLVGAPLCSKAGGIYSGEGRTPDTLNISLPLNSFTQYPVIRRQHSPRVEQKSPRSLRLNLLADADGSVPQYSHNEEEDGQNAQWRSDTLFSAGSQMDDTETSERMSSLCAAGLMSQRVRLSRESSISSLQSPDASYLNFLSSSMQSPLTTPMKEALPDLIQSTTQVEGAHSDSRRCSIPLQLTLYHPDEFSKDIAASVSSHVPSSQSASPSLPHVHCMSQTVLVRKSTLKKDNSVLELACPEIACHPNHSLDSNHRIASGDNLQTDNRDYHEVNRLEHEAASNDQTLLQGDRRTCIGTDKALEGNSLQVESASQGMQIVTASVVDCLSNASQPLRMSQDQSSFVAVDDLNVPGVREELTSFSRNGSVQTVLVSRVQGTNIIEQRTLNMGAMESQPSVTSSRKVLNSSTAVDKQSIEMILWNSSGEMDKEEAQNVFNQGRELLMSPEVKHMPGQREKSYQGLSSPLTTVVSPVRRTSFSKIPRPRQNSEMLSPRSVNSGKKSLDSSLNSSSVTSSSVFVDTSPSSSSSSSSSSRGGHIRRGSEVSGGATAKRQCHIRRSSETKLTDLQTIASTSCQSSSSNRSDISGMGQPVTSPRCRASDIRSGLTDVGSKMSRIPLSNILPSPQSRRGTEAGSLGMSKQQSKIPSPIPKPRKQNLGPVTIPAVATEHMKQSESSGTAISGRRTTVRKEGDTNSKKSTVARGMPDRSAAKIVIESQLELKKIQTVHATKVSQPTRQVAEPDPVKESRQVNVQLDGVDSSSAILLLSSSVNTQSHIQAEELIKDEGEKKTPPPVAARKFQYDSRSLPRWVETHMGQQSGSVMFSDMLGSRSSLDDSVLQLAAERHDLFVPEISGHCVSSLRVKRSQKMQSLMDLFERGSDSNMSDSSGTHSPATQRRVRTFSGSTLIQGGQLTPCMEVGLSTTDDDTFLPPASEDYYHWSKERFPSRTGTGADYVECMEGVGKVRTQRQSDDSLCFSAATDQYGKQKSRDRSHEPADFLKPTSVLDRTSEAERLNHQNCPSVTSASDVSRNSRPLQYCFSSKCRTKDDCSTSESHPPHHLQGSINVSSSRPSSCSEIDLHLHFCNQSLLRDTEQASAVALTLDTRNNVPIEKSKDNSACERNSGENIPSARKMSDRRNSIKELRQLFERADSDSTNNVDIEPSACVVQLPVIRSRVRSISPHTDQGHETRREKVVRLSLEIPPSSVPCSGSQAELKTQPLRLGPKPFYGALK